MSYCLRVYQAHVFLPRYITTQYFYSCMSENKKTIERYIDGFNKLDHKQILSCLTDDVVWTVPGFFHVQGKAAFDAQIDNDAFIGTPTITITRLVEEQNVVVVEGTVTHPKKDGTTLNG